MLSNEDFLKEIAKIASSSTVPFSQIIAALVEVVSTINAFLKLFSK
jgi:hypothetical protein